MEEGGYQGKLLKVRLVASKQFEQYKRKCRNDYLTPTLDRFLASRLGIMDEKDMEKKWIG